MQSLKGLLFLAAVRVGLGALRARIEPALDPVSEPKFFGPTDKKADYPTDDRPATADHFQHGFPELQGTNEFADDFTKDDNGDGGEWHAQATYDAMRVKLAKEKEDLARAEEKQRIAEKELATAKEEQKAAKLEAKEEEEAKAENGEEKSKEEIAKLEAKIAKLENCDEELKDAQVKLKKAIEERKKAVEALEAAEKAEEAAVAAEQKAKEEERKIEADVDKGASDHSAAQKKYEEEVSHLAQVKNDLEAAAKELQKHRDGPHRDHGPAPPQRSSGYRGGALVALLVAFAGGRP